MKPIQRREFLSRLGLGAGASLLLPMAESLLGRAEAQTGSKKIAFVVECTGMNPFGEWGFAPPQLSSSDIADTHRWDPNLPGVTYQSLPWQLDRLSPVRDDFVVVDGLLYESNTPRQHSTTFACLTGMDTDGPPETFGDPLGPSIDQYLARRITGSARFPSINLGVDRNQSSSGFPTSAFAKGPRDKLSHITSPALAFDTYFAGLRLDAGPRSPARGLLLDRIRSDIRRLERALPADERSKLEGYLGSVRELERRESVQVTCETPATPSTTRPEEDVDAMFDMATVALSCGLTNVVGIGIGLGGSNPHFKVPGCSFLNEWPRASDGRITTDFSHDRVNYGPASGVAHRFHLEQMVKMKQAVGDGLVVVYLSLVAAGLQDVRYNNHNHHSSNRFPAILIGSAGGAIRTGGRYLRYGRQDSRRFTTHLYNTLAHALGAPTDSFGGGRMPSNGPLPELLA